MADWVITGGRVVVEEGELRAVARGAGQYVNTPPFSPYVYDRVREAEEALAKLHVSVQRSEEVSQHLATWYFNLDHYVLILHV